MSATFSICLLISEHNAPFVDGAFPATPGVGTREGIPDDGPELHLSIAGLDAAADVVRVEVAVKGHYVRCLIKDGVHFTQSPRVDVPAGIQMVNVSNWPGYRQARLEAAVDRVGGLLADMEALV